jgi:hypothetical protein
MYRNFTNDCLSISVERTSTENKLILRISSDYAGSCRKSQLYVDEKRLGQQLEEVWKSIKTKKLLRLRASFGECDHYDDMTDIYTTPIVYMERGLKRVRFDEREHGSIPKDWSYDVSALFADTTTNTAILEVIKKVLYLKFTKDIEKKFIKSLRPVLQKKERYANYETEYSDED